MELFQGAFPGSVKTPRVIPGGHLDAKGVIHDFVFTSTPVAGVSYGSLTFGNQVLGEGHP